MSLKAFHIVFIVFSILLAFGFGIWSIAQYAGAGRASDLVFGVVSLAAGVGLIFYGKYVLKKLKDISFL
jgi:hypothetical protein